MLENEQRPNRRRAAILGARVRRLRGFEPLHFRLELQAELRRLLFRQACCHLRKDELVEAGAVAIQRTPAGGADLGEDFLQPRAHPVGVGVIDRRRVIVAKGVGPVSGAKRSGCLDIEPRRKLNAESLSAILPGGAQVVLSVALSRTITRSKSSRHCVASSSDSRPQR